MGRFDYIVWTHGTIKLEDDFVDYHYAGDDWPPAEKPSRDEVRHVVSPGPHTVAMGPENTRAISQTFAESITLSKPGLRLNSFHSSINSLAAVLAANISSELDGEKIEIDEFINGDRYAQYRRNPQGG